jgi:hypothetical protein
MVTTRNKVYTTPPGKAKFSTADNKPNQNVEELEDSQSEEGQEESKVAVAAKDEPKFLTADKCEPDDVLMHCPWMCNWVKPLPAHWRKYMVTSPNTNYVDYLNDRNLPTSLFKGTNTYKRTVTHLWECGKKHNKKRSDWPSYFNRTWKGKKLKTTKIDTAAMTSPMRRDNFHNNERRYMTMEKCNAGDVVMKCPNVTCRYVKVLPKDLVGQVDTEVEGKLLVVKTDKEGTTAVRQTCQWKRMRLHSVRCADNIPRFFKERGDM